MRHEQPISVIGGGLAGAEAAYQLAGRGIEVDLYEMRPIHKTAAHKTRDCAELVCSNSMGSLTLGGASAMLKEDVLSLGGFVLSKAIEARVPAGQSLAIDREMFSRSITEALEQHPQIKISRRRIDSVPEDGVCILATGPLTSEELATSLSKKLKQESLYFYDAISPIVETESLDQTMMYHASRYDKGTPDFLNVPLDQATYEALIDDLLTGEVVLPHDFEEEKYFEGCMPIEAIAARGKQTLAFGPLKPVGLRDPKSGKRPYAVIQLRRENKYGTAYNLVGFQTKLKYGEQKRIFRKLPGFENAEFLRLGSLHRNTYLESPKVLNSDLSLKVDSNVFVSGQLTGTEGYLEACASGLYAALNVFAKLRGIAVTPLPNTTMLGALIAEITDSERKYFQPMNANMGILPPLRESIRNKKERKVQYTIRGRKALLEWKQLNKNLFIEEIRPEENCKYSAEPLGREIGLYRECEAPMN